MIDRIVYLMQDNGMILNCTIRQRKWYSHTCFSFSHTPLHYLLAQTFHLKDVWEAIKGVRISFPNDKIFYTVCNSCQ